MRSQRSCTIWVITFTLPCSLACYRDDIFQDSRSCVQGNDSVIFILVLFPLRDAPGGSPICPFDSHTHKLTHAKTLTNSYDLCNSHLFFWCFFSSEEAWLCRENGWQCLNLTRRQKFVCIQIHLSGQRKQCWRQYLFSDVPLQGLSNRSCDVREKSRNSERIHTLHVVTHHHHPPHPTPMWSCSLYKCKCLLSVNKSATFIFTI